MPGRMGIGVFSDMAEFEGINFFGDPLPNGHSSQAYSLRAMAFLDQLFRTPRVQITDGLHALLESEIRALIHAGLGIVTTLDPHALPWIEAGRRTRTHSIFKGCEIEVDGSAWGADVNPQKISPSKDEFIAHLVEILCEAQNDVLQEGLCPKESSFDRPGLCLSENGFGLRHQLIPVSSEQALWFLPLDRTAGSSWD
jgi:hypothetical protein